MKKNLLICFVFIVPMLITHGGYASEGLNTDLVILKINKEVKSLNNEILALKDEIELIKENQRLNSAKILELLQIIELNLSNTKQEKKSTKKTFEKQLEEQMAELDLQKNTLTYKNILNSKDDANNNIQITLCEKVNNDSLVKI